MDKKGCAMRRGRRVAAVTAVLASALAAVSSPAVAQAQMDPNYHWRNDPLTKVMAGKPFVDRVLHRVPGSWFDAAPVSPGAQDALRRGKSLYGPGAPLYVGNFSMCTAAAVGTDSAGRMVAITAGHCGHVGEPVAAADSLQAGWSGRVARKNDALDYAVIELGPNAELTASYNGTTVRSAGGRANPGEVVCKNGYASGATCGAVLGADSQRHFTHLCAMAGDSGAPVYSGERLVGMVSGGLLPPGLNLQCKTPLQGALHAPTVVTNIDAVIADMNSAPGVGQGFVLAR